MRLNGSVADFCLHHKSERRGEATSNLRSSKRTLREERNWPASVLSTTTTTAAAAAFEWIEATREAARELVKVRA